MPYYLKKRITDIIISAVMLVLLFLTLLPIGWMVFSSLKDSADIAVGKIGLRRASADIIEIIPEGNYLWAFGGDGSISKLDLKSKKSIAYTSAKTAATSFAFSPRYIWIASADKGIIRINKNNLKEQKQFSLTREDISKISSSSILVAGDKLWTSIDVKGYGSVVEFDAKNFKFIRTINIEKIIPSSYRILSFSKEGDALWVGGEGGLVKVDLTSGKAAAFYPLKSNGLPISIQKIYNFYLLTSQGAYKFDPHKGKVIAKYNQAKGLLSDQIQSILEDKQRVYFGTNLGISALDKKSGEIKNCEDGDVLSLARQNGELYVGSNGGRVLKFNKKQCRLEPLLKIKKGHFIVRWRNYIDLWKNINFGLYLRNSFIICGFAMFFAMIFSTLAAYALSRFKFPGSDLFSNGILATQMIPAIMYLIPLYIMFVKITIMTGIPIKGTHWGLILVYSAFFIPFSIWILRGFFAAIPVELEEAARIDGASPIQVFWHVALPLAIPGIIATGIYVFLTAWDELMFAWVLTNADTMTVPVGIRLFVGNYQNRFDLMMAAATVATVPVMVLFFMLQRHIVKGLTAGAVKG